MKAKSEDGFTEIRTYQGAIISPVLANIYSHEVLDLWFERDVKPRMKGEAKLYRYADDLIATFQYQEDAGRFMRVIVKRFEKFGLELHPEKTKLIEFGRTAWVKSKRTGIKPDTFNFLGLTHYCGTTLKGKFSVKVKTMASRLRRSLMRVKALCRTDRHKDLSEQYQRLRKVLTGHYAYYGMNSNFRSLAKFFEGVKRLWKKWLSRRGSKGYITWDKLEEILRQYPLPKPRMIPGSLGPRNRIPLYGEYI